MIGIYKITCIINSKVYIGQSTNIEKRIKDHIRRLNNNKHDNCYLQNTWNKHNMEDFIFEPIEEINGGFDMLNEREIYWINEYNALNRKYGFNLAAGGSNGYSLAGKTEEEKIEIGKRVGATRSKLYSGKNSPNYGKHMSEAQKKKISIGLSGDKNPNFGKKRHEHSKAMTGEHNPRARKIICVNNKEIFNCAKYAAEKYNTTNSNILKCCHKKQKTAGKNINGIRLIWNFVN